MKLCWNFDDKNRPSFSELLKDLEAIHMTYLCQREALDGGSQATTVHNKNYNLVQGQIAMMPNPAFIFNQTMVPYETSDANVPQSRFTSATLVLEPSPPTSRHTSTINTTYHNFNGRPAPICEPNGVCTVDSDINDNFVDLDGYQLPKMN